VVIGHEKGNDTKSRIERNFGMAARRLSQGDRLMDMADRFGCLSSTLVDTPGAYPGKGAEERGQSKPSPVDREMPVDQGAAGQRHHR